MTHVYYKNDDGDYIRDEDEKYMRGEPEDCCCEDTIDPCDEGFVEADYDIELEVSGATYSSECGFSASCGAQIEQTYLLTWNAGLSAWVFSGNITASCGSTVAKEIYLGLKATCSGVLTMSGAAPSTDGGLNTAAIVLGNTNAGTDNQCSGVTASRVFAGDPVVGTFYDLTEGAPGYEHSGVTCPCIFSTSPVLRFRFVAA